MSTAISSVVTDVVTVVKAGYYDDCQELPLYGWAARQGVPTSKLMEVLWFVGHYNAFAYSVVASALKALDPGDDLVWYIGREYSVVLYGRGDEALLWCVAESANLLRADEADMVDGAVRLWWD